MGDRRRIVLKLSGEALAAAASDETIDASIVERLAVEIAQTCDGLGIELAVLTDDALAPAVRAGARQIHGSAGDAREPEQTQAAEQHPFAAAPVGQATAHIGQPVADRPFIGHVTIARGARGADLRQAPHLLSSLSASWPVTSLALVHSQLGAGVARYRDIYTVSLGSSRDQSRPPGGPT